MHRSFSLLISAALLLCLLAPPFAPAKDRDGRWAQAPFVTREWFRAQRSPRTGVSCCDEADGEQVEEDIRDHAYWIRSDKTEEQWLRVPDDVIIKGPNLWGRPVAWFRHEDGKPIIYCYAPGPLL